MDFTVDGFHHRATSVGPWRYPYIEFIGINSPPLDYCDLNMSKFEVDRHLGFDRK